MMYTFENIEDIKIKISSKKSKETYIKKIDSVKDGIFKDFDYSEFKHNLKFPKNESLQTYYELKTLVTLPIDEDFIKEKDEIEQCFEKICKNNGIEYPKELVDTLVKSSTRNYFRFKNDHNRPRPTQLSEKFDIKLTKQMILPSMKTPSFPLIILHKVFLLVRC